MTIDTSFLERCILTLEKALKLLEQTDEKEISYDLYRSACVKEFEIILEQTGKLLKRCLKPYFHSPKEADKLYFKDIFRQATNHGLISLEEAERWFTYRENRNNTAHDYGVGFAQNTLLLLPNYLRDAKNIVKVIQSQNAKS